MATSRHSGARAKYRGTLVPIEGCAVLSTVKPISAAFRHLQHRLRMPRASRRLLRYLFTIESNQPSRLALLAASALFALSIYRLRRISEMDASRHFVTN
jgi:hypothetical protein